jgi:putative ABC transport system permease protein
MFLRLVYESFRRQKRRKLLAGSAVALGVGVTTAMIAVATDVGDKISTELRSYGANLVITPQDDTLDLEVGGVNLKPPSDGAYLNEGDLPRIKGIFWHNNIVGFAPMLAVNINVPAHADQITLLGTYFARQVRFGKDQFVTGVRSTFPWWKVQGAWPDDNSQEVLVGERLAARLSLAPGRQVEIGGQNHPISGILSTGGEEDNQIVAPLGVAQQVLGRSNAVRQVYVSAITKPEDAFARRDPKTLSGAMYDRWYCSPYPQSIAYQLQEAIANSHAEQIRRIAQNEGRVLSRIKGLMLLVTLAALLASALAVSAAMATTMFERRAEVGLMKALGAGRFSVATLFFTEAALLAVTGGVAGFLAGSLIARQIGHSIFNSQIAIQPALLPLILMIAAAVTLAGSAIAIRRAVELDPVRALRGEI